MKAFSTFSFGGCVFYLPCSSLTASAFHYSLWGLKRYKVTCVGLRQGYVSLDYVSFAYVSLGYVSLGYVSLDYIRQGYDSRG